MKKTQEILGLPVISISNGVEAGRVKGILVDGEKGSVNYLVVDEGIQVYGARVIPSSDILGIGEDALTIESENVIVDINQIPEAVQQLKKDIQVKGTRVLTKKGKIIGEIGDFYVDDEDHFSIIGLEFIVDSLQKETRIIPRKSVITFGKTLTIVENYVESSLLNLPAELPPEEEAAASIEPDNNENTIALDGLGMSFDIEETEQEEAAAPSVAPSVAQKEEVEPQVENNQPSPAADNAAQLFEQKQRQYLNGRRVTKNVVDNFGNIIVAEGTIITDQIIDEVKAKGKLIELVMNNKG